MATWPVAQGQIARGEHPLHADTVEKVGWLTWRNVYLSRLCRD